MRELYRKHKRDIWIGVVVSLITAAILKFGDWLIDVLPSVGISIFETISNVLYTLAATHTDNILLRILLLGSFGLLAGTAINYVIDGIKVYKAALNLEKKSKRFSDEELDKVNKEALAELDEDQKNPAQKSIPETIKHGKKLGKAAISLTLTMALLYMFITFFVTTPMSLYNKFEQDMVKIAPYVEEHEILQLKSDWVCMRSKAEYNELYEKINTILIEKGLPK